MTRPDDRVHSHDAADPCHDDVVRVSCVRHTYEDGTSVDLCGFDFVAHGGSRVALLGPNGAGKTTLLFHILGLLRAEEGHVRVFDHDPATEWPAIRRRIGIVLQNVDEQIIMPTVRDDVAFSPRQYGLADEEVDALVDRALALLDIEHLAERVPHNLSGGEKRKVALAGALVMEPELLVLDEPLEGLDPASRSTLVELLRHLAHERGVTIVMSTHDIDAVPELADYAYVLAQGGAIVLKGTPQEIFAQSETIAKSNIRPPLLAELFRRLKDVDPSTPEPALTIDEAVEKLAGRTRG